MPVRASKSDTIHGPERSASVRRRPTFGRPDYSLENLPPLHAEYPWTGALLGAVDLDSLAPFTALAKLAAGSPINRLLNWLRHHRDNIMPSTDARMERPRGLVCKALLPSHLPPMPAELRCGESLKRGRIGKKIRLRRLAWSWTEMLVAAFSYYATDSPKAVSQYEERLGPYNVHGEQHVSIMRLYKDILRVASL